MAQTQARYDQFAEWYEQWIGDAPPLIAAHAGLLPAVTGDRVLDIACGQGRMSRYLARLGADVTGIDIPAAMLGKVRAAGPGNITYIHADVTGHLAWWDGRSFDGCTCELALMDIDDLTGTLSTVTAVLRPGGWFAASIVHPCFPGNFRHTCCGGAAAADRQPCQPRSPPGAASATAPPTRAAPAADLPRIGLSLTWTKKENVRIVRFAPQENRW